MIASPRGSARHHIGSKTNLRRFLSASLISSTRALHAYACDALTNFRNTKHTDTVSHTWNESFRPSQRRFLPEFPGRLHIVSGPKDFSTKLSVRGEDKRWLLRCRSPLGLLGCGRCCDVISCSLGSKDGSTIIDAHTRTCEHRSPTNRTSFLLQIARDIIAREVVHDGICTTVGIYPNPGYHTTLKDSAPLAPGPRPCETASAPGQSLIPLDMLQKTNGPSQALLQGLRTLANQKHCAHLCTL